MELIISERSHAIHSIPFWKLLISSAILIIILLSTSVIVCVTNAECRNKVPAVSSVMSSSFAAPFMVSAISLCLALHLFVSNLLYFMTIREARIWSKFLRISAVVVYVTVIITLFVFPFTDWSSNYANVAVLVAFGVWMGFVLKSLKIHYRHTRSIVFFWSCFICGLYVVSVIIYLVFRFGYIDDKGVLLGEIGIGLGLFGFLNTCIVHVWEVKIKVEVN